MTSLGLTRTRPFFKYIFKFVCVSVSSCFLIRMYFSVALRVCLGTLISFYASRRGLKKQSLDITGAISAFCVGTISMICGYRFGILLLGFYFSGSKLTTYQECKKVTMDGSVKKGGQRSARQVLACSLLGCSVCSIYLILIGDDAPLDGTSKPWATFLWGCYIGHYACCAADTWASELGILSKKPPRLITTWAVVPPGTNGGVSVLGTVASAAGGFFIGLLFYVSGLVLCPSGVVPQWPVLVFGIVSGLIGSILDSIVGATLQVTWFDTSTNKISPRPPARTTAVFQHICGLDVLTNEQVNLVSLALTTLLSGYLALFFF
jgi:uncharacterized protein (TIGR00297 family)